MVELKDSLMFHLNIANLNDKIETIPENMLFGNKQAKGGVYVTDIDEAPIGAFLFERRKKKGHKRLYVVYCCKCTPTDISAETIEDGKGNYETKSISYSIGSVW